ncbi:MAG: YdbL family protein [Pseudomonadota bacterium]|nr:YdbL family protein [Pseudomonadota bacterium]
MKRRILSVALALLAGPAMAQDAVVAARSSGIVGERYDGYLGVVGTLTPALRAQVAAVNIKRRALFSDLAARRGVSAQDVGVAAACALFARVAVGEAYQLSGGQWQRREAGQPAPRPDYCG